MYFFKFYVNVIQSSNILFLGNVGIVKDATECTARVELHSSCQTISVDTGHIASAGDRHRVNFYFILLEFSHFNFILIS